MFSRVLCRVARKFFNLKQTNLYYSTAHYTSVYIRHYSDCAFFSGKRPCPPYWLATGLSSGSQDSFISHASPLKCGLLSIRRRAPGRGRETQPRHRVDAYRYQSWNRGVAAALHWCAALHHATVLAHADRGCRRRLAGKGAAEKHLAKQGRGRRRWHGRRTQVIAVPKERV